MRMIIFGCAALLLANVFEEQPIQRYQYVCTGRRAFLTGKILYIFVASAVYAVLIWVVMVLPHIHQICLEGSWANLDFLNYHGKGIQGGCHPDLIYACIMILLLNGILVGLIYGLAGVSYRQGSKRQPFSLFN